MKERPIIFSGDMVKAILDNRKTQTRRVIPGLDNTDYFVSMEKDKAIFSDHILDIVSGVSMTNSAQYPTYSRAIRCPYGVPGERLWLRESFGLVWNSGDPDFPPPESEMTVEYKADLPVGCTDYPGGWPIEEAKGNPDAPKWKSSRFMPRKYSRITLEIVNVRVERLHEIWTRAHTWDDCFAEGIPQSVEWEGDNGTPTPLSMFIELWNSINSKRGYDWVTNPWVWVIEFERI